MVLAGKLTPSGPCAATAVPRLRSPDILDVPADAKIYKPTMLDIARNSCRHCDFFRFLYQTIQQKLQGELANRWEDANIEFIFSVPTTWKPVPTVERFRSTIERAGFGRHPNHRADIGLTEAEAAAVDTARVFPRLFNV